jgi:prophage regulatory protein
MNQATNQNLTQLLRLPSVKQLIGKSRTTIYRDIQRGLFPRGVFIGGDRVAWPSSEIEALNKARIAGKTDTDIKKLVEELHQARTTGQ